MKLRVVEDCRDAWPVQALCRVLGVSTAGHDAWRTFWFDAWRTSWFDAWRSRPESKRAAADRALLDDIRRHTPTAAAGMAARACMQRSGQAGGGLAAAGSSA